MELGVVQDAEAKRVELTTKTAAETAEKARPTVEEAQLTIIITNLYETRMRTHHSSALTALITRRVHQHAHTPMHGPSLSSINTHANMDRATACAASYAAGNRTSRFGTHLGLVA